MGNAPKAVADLIQRFRNHSDFYCSGQYKETDLRNEFLDPFFEALGWDVANKAGLTEVFEPVIHRGPNKRETLDANI